MFHGVVWNANGFANPGLRSKTPRKTSSAGGGPTPPFIADPEFHTRPSGTVFGLPMVSFVLIVCCAISVVLVPLPPPGWKHSHAVRQTVELPATKAEDVVVMPPGVWKFPAPSFVATVVDIGNCAVPELSVA